MARRLEFCIVAKRDGSLCRYISNRKREFTTRELTADATARRAAARRVRKILELTIIL